MPEEVNFSEAKVCQPEKRIHDICFFHWYQEDFLKGKSDTNLDACEEQWDVYQRCLEKKLKAWDLTEKIEKIKQESPITDE